MNFILFLAIVIVHTGCVANSAFFTASPDKIIPGATPKLTIDCDIRPLLPAISNVFIIQIEKKDNGSGVSLASITSQGVTINTVLSTRMTVVGDIDFRNGHGPFITLTIEKPVRTDEGRYGCSVSTTDKTGTLVNLSYETIVSSQDLTLHELSVIVMNLTIDLTALMTENKALHNNLTDYQTRLDGLEKKSCSCKGDTTNITQALKDMEAKFTQELMTQDNEFSKLTNETAELRTNQSAIRYDVDNWSKRTQSLISETIYMSTRFDLIENRIQVLENISAEQYKEIAQLSVMRDGLGFSYFNAHVNQSSISFLSKVTDTTNSYDPSTGIFTAPVSGIYQLSLSIASDQGSVQVAIKVRENLVAYVVTTHSLGPQQGSTSVAVSMAKGDTATVKISHLLQGHVDLRKDSCLFSGILLGQ